MRILSQVSARHAKIEQNREHDRQQMEEAFRKLCERPRGAPAIGKMAAPRMAMLRRTARLHAARLRRRPAAGLLPRRAAAAAAWVGGASAAAAALGWSAGAAAQAESGDRRAARTVIERHRSELSADKGKLSFQEPTWLERLHFAVDDLLSSSSHPRLMILGSSTAALLGVATASFWRLSGVKMPAQDALWVAWTTIADPGTHTLTPPGKGEHSLATLLLRLVLLTGSEQHRAMADHLASLRGAAAICPLAGLYYVVAAAAADARCMVQGECEVSAWCSRLVASSSSRCSSAWSTTGSAPVRLPPCAF